MRKVNQRKKRKKRGQRRPWQMSLSFIIILVLLIGMAFVFALSLLVTQVEPTPSQAEPTTEEFIADLVPHAKSIQQRHAIFPSIIIGQAILESNWGKSELSSRYNNLFGIKAYGEGEKITLKTKEFIDNKWIEVAADFKVYPNREASMDDHAALFLNGVSWNKNLYQEVLSATTYQEAAMAIQKAGYATDPTYADKVIQVIEANNLSQYDD